MKNYCDRCKRIDEECTALVDIKIGTIHLKHNTDEGREFWKAVGGFPKELNLCNVCFVNLYKQAITNPNNPK